jgi:hypothetical protein
MNVKYREDERRWVPRHRMQTRRNIRKNEESSAGCANWCGFSTQQLSVCEATVIDPKPLDQGLLPSDWTDGRLPHPPGQIWNSHYFFPGYEYTRLARLTNTAEKKRQEYYFVGLSPIRNVNAKHLNSQQDRYSRGTRWRSWSRHCATSRMVMGSFSDVVIGIFH